MCKSGWFNTIMFTPTYTHVLTQKHMEIFHCPRHGYTKKGRGGGGVGAIKILHMYMYGGYTYMYHHGVKHATFSYVWDSKKNPCEIYVHVHVQGILCMIK